MVERVLFSAGGATEAKQDDVIDALAAGVSVLNLTQLVPNQYDEVDLGYTADELTSVIYSNNGVTVATLALTYTAGNLTHIERS